jgi:hypothetical protein
MLPKDKRIGLSRIEFYVVVALLVPALWGIWKYGIYKPRVLSQTPLTTPPPDAEQNQSPETHPLPNAVQSAFSATPPGPTDWQKMSVTVEGNTGALLTTLATALFGAVGWLVFEARKKSKKRHLWAAFLAALCTSISLFCGAASQGHLVWMLSRENFNPYDSVYMLLNLAQFGFLGAGACFLAGFAIYDLSEENP